MEFYPEAFQEIEGLAGIEAGRGIKFQGSLLRFVAVSYRTYLEKADQAITIVKRIIKEVKKDH